MRLETREEAQLLQQLEKPTILIVDDEEIIRDLCARALKDYRILQAENGQAALKILDQQEVDLILADIMMPIMNGLDLLLQVKERDPSQLVIVMTGYADKDIILRHAKLLGNAGRAELVHIVHIHHLLPFSLELHQALF